MRILVLILISALMVNCEDSAVDASSSSSNSKISGEIAVDESLPHNALSVCGIMMFRTNDSGFWNAASFYNEQFDTDEILNNTYVFFDGDQGIREELELNDYKTSDIVNVETMYELTNDCSFRIDLDHQVEFLDANNNWVPIYIGERAQ